MSLSFHFEIKQNHFFLLGLIHSRLISLIVIRRHYLYHPLSIVVPVFVTHHITHCHSMYHSCVLL